MPRTEQRHDKPAREAGFTLVELLVALVLFAMLSAVLFSALRFGAASLNRIIRHQAQVADLSVTQRVLGQWVQTAYPEYLPPPALPSLHGAIDFTGGPARIMFLAPAPESVASGGFARMVLWLADDKNGGKNLMLSAQPKLAWAGSQVTQEVLLHGIAGARFAYSTV